MSERHDFFDEGWEYAPGNDGWAKGGGADIWPTDLPSPEVSAALERGFIADLEARATAFLQMLARATPGDGQG